MGDTTQRPAGSQWALRLRFHYDLVQLYAHLYKLFLCVLWKYRLVCQHTNFNTGFNTPPERSLGVMVSKRNLIFLSIMLFALGQIGWDIMVLQKSSHCSGNRDIGVNGLLFCFCFSVGFSACVYFLEHTASRHFEGHIRQSFRAIDQATYVYDHNRSLVSGHVLLTGLGFFFFFCYPYLLHHFAVRGPTTIFLGACEVLRL